MTNIKEALEKDLKEVSLRGWIYRKRELKDKIFVVLRDKDEIIQCVFSKENFDEKSWKELLELQIEASIEVFGFVREDPRAPNGKEVEVKNYKIFDKGLPFPLHGREEVSTIMKYRHLWIRSRKFNAILKIKATLMQALREWLEKNEYIEVNPPIIIPVAVEEVQTLFEINYFDKKAYLTQSSQLYLEALIYSLEKVYCLAPSFRAEKSRTRRHLHEYWHLEIESAWYDLKDIMRDAESMVKYGIEKVIEKNEKELKFLKRDTKILENYVEKPFEKITYEKAIEILQSKGLNINYGDDLGADEERVLTLEFEVPIFVTHYPRKLKAFYMKESGNGKTVENFDLLASEGYGEIIGGSQREDDYEILKNKIIEWNLPLEKYEWYLDLRRYGSVPHSGFGLGIERMLMWVCKLEHIRDTLPFPRLRETEILI
ncbi:MAG: asparagine--tRNA ligase [Candidatus Aenigmarchaeota archaeon]|nr:asparagine--tRNA ligase [Candidatus Aenigmarchaeota archaeon]